MSGDPIVAVPADLEVEDRLVGPITFRMAGWLAAAAAGVALLALARDQMWTVGPALLLVTVGLAGALWQPGGRPAPAWVGPLWSYRRRARTAATDLNSAAPEPAVVSEPEPVAQPAPDVDNAWTQDLPAAERFGRFRRARPALVVGMALLVLAAVAVDTPARLTDRAWWGPTVTSTDTSPGGDEGSSGPTGSDAPARPDPTSVQPPGDASADPQPGVLVPVDPLELWLDEHHHDQVYGWWSGCGC